MSTMFQKLWKALGCPAFVFILVLGVSVFSLAAALAGEIFFGLEPCRLCIYQRWPFVVTAILSAIGLMFIKRKTIAAILLALSSASFFTNALIAFYHTGVEQKWWVSRVEGCAVPQFEIEDQSWIDNIMAAPSKPCDVIPWQDPIIGLSMANMNVILGIGMTLICLIPLTRMRKNNAALH